MYAETVPFPTAVGPASTVKCGDWVSVTGLPFEMFDVFSALVGSQATKTPAGSDPEFPHDRRCPDLPDARDGLQHILDTDALQSLVRIRSIEKLAHGDLSIFKGQFG